MDEYLSETLYFIYTDIQCVIVGQTTIDQQKDGTFKSNVIIFIKYLIKIFINILLFLNLSKAGLSKLIDARSIVAKLKSDAGVQEAKLAEKQEKANQALNMISRTMQGANTKKEQMESLRKEFQIKNDFLNQRYITKNKTLYYR